MYTSSSSVPQEFLYFGDTSQTLDSIGAAGVNRTPDLLITNQLLYQLSYSGLKGLYDQRFTGAIQRQSSNPAFALQENNGSTDS